MPTVPTNKLERELRKQYLVWLAGLPKAKDTTAYVAKFERESRALISKLGGQAASLGAYAGFPVPQALELSPRADVAYDAMKQAAIKAGIAAGLQATDVARQILNAGVAQGFNKLNRLARTETVSAYWKNAWDSVADLPDIVMVWGSEESKRTCDYCLSRDGLVVEDGNIRDHPNGRCTPIPTLRSLVKYKGTLQPDGSVEMDPRWADQKVKGAKAQASAGPTTAEQRDPLSGKSNPAKPSVAEPVHRSEPRPPAPTTSPVLSANEANKWGSEKMLDLKTLSPDVQEQIKLYTGGGYKGTNRALRDGKFTGYNGPIQKDMVNGLDEAMKVSKTTEDVLVNRVMSLDAFPGGDPAALVGKTLQDKGFLSTAVGGRVSGTGFKSAQVEMQISVPAGTPALWTKPLSQFKNERELLLDRNTKLSIVSAEKNKVTGKWIIKAEVEKPTIKTSTTVMSKPTKEAADWSKKKTPKYIVDDLAEQTSKLANSEYMETINEYTNGGAFSPVNAQLRGVKRKDTGFDEFFAGEGDEDNAGYLKQFTEDLDKAIGGQRTMSDMTLYRGVESGSLGELSRGTILTDKGYMSTTLNPAVAEGFASSGDILRITYPGGNPALFVDALPDVNLGQSEVLLPRGQKMKVTNIQDIGGRRVISVTIQ